MPFMEVLSRCMKRQNAPQSRLALTGPLTGPGLTSSQMASKGALEPDLVCSGRAALADTPPFSAKPYIQISSLSSILFQ